ncbi:integrase [Streptomyces sp. NPDC050703]|uniref:integrase n=1 Tax=Streptomyces sp. NPDC050703 TaxID=3157218 RepID=UPI003414935D
MLIRFAYLAVTHASAALRLLPMSERDKDVEILALRHQIVLERQLGPGKVDYRPEDRAFLAALLAPLPRQVLPRLWLIIQPETVLRWHRSLIKRHHAAACGPKRPGRPRMVHSVRRLALRPVRENPGWGYRRIHGELTMLGVKIAASTVWEILQDTGIDPARQRTATTWTSFLRSQADALMACDFIETVTLTGQRRYILAAIEHTTRRVRVLGTTAHPNAAWVTQAARNLVMDLDDAGTRIRYLIRDRDTKFPALFDQILTDAGITVVRSGVRIPRMNSIMERWVQTCRHELLDRTLGNLSHLSTAATTVRPMDDALSFESFLEGAKKAAHRAMDDHGRGEYDEFALHGGVAVEKLAKAVLVSMNPVYLLEMRNGNPDMLLYLGALWGS